MRDEAFPNYSIVMLLPLLLELDLILDFTLAGALWYLEALLGR